MVKTLYISATQAQLQLGRIFNHISAGGKVVITKYGRDLANITPAIKREKKYSDEFLNFISENAIKTNKKLDLTKEIRKMRDEE